MNTLFMKNALKNRIEVVQDYQLCRGTYLQFKIA